MSSTAYRSSAPTVKANLGIFLAKNLQIGASVMLAPDAGPKSKEAVMFILSFVLIFISFNFFSPEQLVTTIVGAFVSLGVTQWFKNGSGLAGLGATVAAFVIAFIVAFAAVVISTILTGGKFSLEMLAASGLQIFALATLAYKTMLADRS
jgi:hypothetical protein